MEVKKLIVKNTKNKKVRLELEIAASTMLFQSCATATKTQKGTVIGVAAGGTLGAILGGANETMKQEAKSGA